MKHVLIVEDEIELGELIGLWMELSDFEVSIERDGQAALANFRGDRVDILLVDLMMPVMDGREFIRCLRAAGHQHPIIVFSAAKPDLENELQHLNIAAWLQKPLNESEREQLVTLMNELLETADA